MRSGPAWSRRRAPALPTTTTEGSRARRRPCDRAPEEGGVSSRTTHAASGKTGPGRRAAAGVSGREERVLGIIETARAKRPRFKDQQVTLAHGAGGKATRTLIEGLFVPAFAPPEGGSLSALADAGAVALNGVGLAMTTDSFVVKPLRFPGGSIGELAVNGTVNDLAVAGA